MKVYISGMITGLPIETARANFARAEAELSARGFTVINPTKNGLNVESSWNDHMKADIKLLLDCDTIFMLQDYKQSKGALLEHYIAKELGLEVEYEIYRCSVCNNILNEFIFMSTVCSRCNKRVCVDCIDQNDLTDVCDKCRDDEKQKEPICYNVYQRKEGFLSNFKAGHELYNENFIFNRITHLHINGASVYDLLLELICMMDGQTTPTISHITTQIPHAYD